MVALPDVPLSELRKRPHISYSAIRSFLWCPQKFYYSYTEKREPSHKPIALILGGAVHKALEVFYKHAQVTGEKLCEEGLLAAFRDRVDCELDSPVPIRLDTGGEGDDMIDVGVSLLRAFFEQVEVPQVLGVEVPFAAPLIDPATGEVFGAPLIGCIDLLVENNGLPLVVEHKTTARKYSREQLSYELQPSCYQYAATHLGMSNARLLYQFLVKGRNPSVQHCFVERTDAHVREMLSTFCEVVRCVDAGRFWRVRSWACKDCTFAYLCNEGM